MRFGGKALIGLMVAGCAAVSPMHSAASSLDTRPATPAATSPLAAPDLTPDARYLLQWALETGDHHHQPFAIVDKKWARIFVFDAEGQLVGAANALLGQAVGDHTLAGVSDEEVPQLAPADRTTPAGRFASQPGRNLSGEATPAFFDAVLKPTLGQQRGVVYVLPERQPVQAMFGRPLPLAQGH